MEIQLKQLPLDKDHFGICSMSKNQGPPKEESEEKDKPLIYVSYKSLNPNGYYMKTQHVAPNNARSADTIPESNASGVYSIFHQRHEASSKPNTTKVLDDQTDDMTGKLWLIVKEMRVLDGKSNAFYL